MCRPGCGGPGRYPDPSRPGVAAEEPLGLSGTTRAHPGLDQALAAVRKGDTLVVPKLDRLARSLPDARTIADQL